MQHEDGVELPHHDFYWPRRVPHGGAVVSLFGRARKEVSPRGGRDELRRLKQDRAPVDPFYRPL